ncbi:MAG: 7-carboxy-7-deazaguanine synthase QueE [Rickettsiales bacterium]|nr:7-carboxy-7-deazaguanine synthase QueE [Rickettsiales bacterium]
MFGRNKILKPEKHEGQTLKVVEMFPTIQGEGPFAGKSATFIRLGGCNLACDFCDTEFDEYQELSLEEIVDEVEKKPAKLVVITGGEPMRQPIEKLCQQLVSIGYQVQIETNGTIYRDLPKEVSIVCSPKVNNGKYYQIRADLLPRISAFKFIISQNKKEYLDVLEVGQSKYNIPVYVQPMDEYDENRNRQNRELAIKISKENNFILSLQIHKILGLK